MFELPGAKRVRREDLQSRRSSRSPSPAESTTVAYAARALRNIFSSIETYTPPSLQAAHPEPDLEHIQDEEEEQEFEFRLFRTPLVAPAWEDVTGKQEQGNKGRNLGDETDRKRTDELELMELRDAGIQKFKIRLRSPTPTASDGIGGFVVPFRGWEYYFSDPEWARRKVAGDEAIKDDSIKLDTRQKERFIDAAVCGEKILERAKNGIWPGCHLPWRVIHLKTASSSKDKSKKSPDSSQPAGVILTNSLGVIKVPKSRNKPGKKRRIVLRQRQAAARTAEEADREKRARRNREKKIKKRQREKQRKATLRELGNGQGKSEVGDAMDNDTSD
ncbi:hypothetical protein AJ78_00490 [Emergomyces pasteurianus Ep9510]|uniref:Uncharacterized protein n=1 Tax=Emergomyces pasteurianus Ep9510 TaxID=1447872 RepID=A0A1J9QTJ0_9EURO|nr:hypothetical protein AJ78_00490 [Emergomyces pasteurianus Ep9510]